MSILYFLLNPDQSVSVSVTAPLFILLTSGISIKTFIYSGRVFHLARLCPSLDNLPDSVRQIHHRQVYNNPAQKTCPPVPHVPSSGHRRPILPNQKTRVIGFPMFLQIKIRHHHDLMFPGHITKRLHDLRVYPDPVSRHILPRILWKKLRELNLRKKDQIRMLRSRFPYCPQTALQIFLNTSLIFHLTKRNLHNRPPHFSYSFDQNIFIYTTLFSFPHHISYLNISPVPLSITVSYITTDTDFPPHQVPSAYASQIPYAHKIQPPAEHTP